MPAAERRIYSDQNVGLEAADCSGRAGGRLVVASDDTPELCRRQNMKHNAIAA
jgi:hypothetical protein